MESNQIFISVFILWVFDATHAVHGRQIAPDLKRAKDTSVIIIGGALRYNYTLSSWKEEQVKRGGDFGLDMFRVNVDAAWKKISLHAEYRFYSKDFGGSFLKDGYLRYTINDSTWLDIGLSQNPFGNLPYNSHNWFFSLPYYVGMEDKYAMGIKWQHRHKRWRYDAAFYKNAMELNFGNNTAIDPGRYSYDVAGRNKEVNQGNLRAEYFPDKAISIGASAMLGGLYNIPQGNMGAKWGTAIHTNLSKEKWNIKLQSLYYQYNIADSASHNQWIEMAAYGAVYRVASKAFIHTGALSYHLPLLHLGPIAALTFYENYSFMQKTQEGFNNTQMNVLGCMISSGHVVTYVDWAAGQNHPWLGPVWNDALSAGNRDARWYSRFNINIGYYF